MIKLPFLKNRLPRVAQDGPSPKLIHGTPQDFLEHHMSTELMEAVPSKDIKRFRSALEALVLNMFDFDGDDQ